jgi:hypothetical protein
MAPLTSEGVLQAQEARAEARLVRLEGVSSRVAAQVLRGAADGLREAHPVTDRAGLGTWPYWAPPARDLSDVLVVLPDAA